MRKQRFVFQPRLKACIKNLNGSNCSHDSFHTGEVFEALSFRNLGETSNQELKEEIADI